jgi:hypothetical protein
MTAVDQDNEAYIAPINYTTKSNLLQVIRVFFTFFTENGVGFCAVCTGERQRCGSA